MRKYLVLGLLPTEYAFAAAETSANAGIIQWLASSLLVLALIIGLAWALKKTRLVPQMGRPDFKVLFTLPVGYKEKLMIVQAGEEQLLLGVTAQQITYLHKIEPPLPVQSEPHAFSQQLARFMKKTPDRGGE